MKSIEERAKECTCRRADVLVGTTLASIFEKGYIAGATDQKIIDEDVRLLKCDVMTKEELERESTFLEQYANGKGNRPSVSDAIEWARKTTIEKACKWLEKELQKIAVDEVKENFLENNFNLILKSQVPVWLTNFRKAMEE